MRFTSAPSRSAGSRAVAGDVDAGQHDLAIAVARPAGATCATTSSDRHRARIAAAERDDAEGAAVVAAVLHLHEGAGAALDAVDRDAARSRVTAMMSSTRDLRVASSAAQVAARRASPRCRARGRPPAWRRSAAGSVCAAQPVTTMRASGRSRREPADRLARLPHRFAGDRAGVDDDGIGDAGGRGLAADHLGFGGVEPAAEGDDSTLIAAPAFGEQRRIERALELEFDRAGHQHVVVALAPFDREIAARQRHASPCGRCASAARRRPRRRRRPSRRPWSGRRRAPRCG